MTVPRLLDFLDREDRPLSEVADATSDVALEIAISWGASVLSVSHLSPPRNFVIGDRGGSLDAHGASGEVDFFLPEEVLGRRQLPLVQVEGGVVKLTIVDFSEGTLKEGKEEVDLRDLLASAPNCSTVTRAKEVILRSGARAQIRLRDFEFRVALVKKSAPIDRGFFANWDSAVSNYFLATVVTAGALMSSLAYFVPPLGLSDEEGLDKKRQLLISQYLDAASEREQEKEDTFEPEAGAAEEGAQAQRAEGEAGEAGKPDTIRTNKRVAVKGPRDNTQLQLSRHEALALAQEFGMIGLLASSQSSDPLAPTSVFGANLTMGSDDLSAHGNFFGDEPGESGGFGGLSMSGTGFGGGDLLGSGLGIGLGRIGTIGPGMGKEGWGRGHSLPSGSHKPRVPTIRPMATTVSGRLPPQVIQRVVRQNFGRFRMCYSQALGRNPNLEGRVPVRFVIGRDGAVSNVSAGGDLPDAQVRACVQSAFYGLSFPQPEGGIVTVTYPLMFSPG